MQKIIRHELVSVAIPANSTLSRFVIPDLPNLREVLTFGLQVYNSDQVTKDIVSGNAVLSSATVLNTAFFTFVNYGGKEFLKQAPAQMFNTLQNLYNPGLIGGGTNYTELNTKTLIGQKISFPKSFIEFSTPPATIVDQAFIFSVYYSLPLLQERRDSGFSFSRQG